MGIEAENSSYQESAESDVIRYSPLRSRDSTEETSAGRTPVTVLQFSYNSLTDKKPFHTLGDTWIDFHQREKLKYGHWICR